MNNLQGKVALITGASRGIGASVAQMLAAAGADIVINYRTKSSRAEEVAQAVRGYGRDALVVQRSILYREAWLQTGT